VLARLTRKENDSMYKAPTLKSLNEFINYTYPDINTELVKGEGYFYFTEDMLDVDSIMVPYLRHFTKQRWIEEINSAVEDYMETENERALWGVRDNKKLVCIKPTYPNVKVLK
jgi:hypothetical protein|tara:strand:+ start:41 stop:379 length:339 start_codon:yes stop_codon:yes gene_type:complete